MVQVNNILKSLSSVILRQISQPEFYHIPLSHIRSNGSLHPPTMLQTPQQLSASSSRETLSPNDGQLCRSASDSTHNIDIRVEPPVHAPLSHLCVTTQSCP